MSNTEAATWSEAFTNTCAKVAAANGWTAEQAFTAVWAEMDDRRRFCVAEAARFVR